MRALFVIIAAGAAALPAMPAAASSVDTVRGCIVRNVDKPTYRAVWDRLGMAFGSPSPEKKAAADKAEVDAMMAVVKRSCDADWRALNSTQGTDGLLKAFTAARMDIINQDKTLRPRFR